MKRFVVALGVAGLAVMVGVTGFYIQRSVVGQDAFAECRKSKGGGGSIGGPFTLVDQTGKTVTEKEVITGPTLVYFGFTSCKDVCPIDSARNAEVIDLLAAQGITATPVFISIDPQRDTPDILAEYVKYFHERMIGLTGSPEQVKAAASAYKVFYHKVSDVPDYEMTHTTFTYLMLPDSGFAEFYQRDMPARDMAASVACFANAM